MKRILFLLLFVCSFASGQIQKLEVIGLDTLTTTERNTITVPGDRVYFIYNETTGQFEYNVKGSGWTTFSGGGSGDVTAASAFGTDNALIRSDGTGKGVQSSGWLLSDTGDMTAGGHLDLNGFSISNSIGNIMLNDVVDIGSQLNAKTIVPDGANTWFLGVSGSEWRAMHTYDLFFAPQGTSVKGWEMRSQTSGDDLVLLAETGSGTGSFTPVIYKFNDSGTPTDATDLVTKGYADANYSGGGGSGDVVGPASATDNAIARFDTTTGKLLQNSGVTIDDSGNISGANRISVNDGGNSTYIGQNSGTNDDGTTNINAGFGYQALRDVTTGSGNVGFGPDALQQLTTGSNNMGIGYQALLGITTASSNIGIGKAAGRFITGFAANNITGSQSIFIGQDTKAAADGETNQIVIGHDATGNGSNTATWGNTSITDHYFTGNINVTGTVDGVDISALTGTDVALADAGAYFTTDNVEAATQELAADVAGKVDGTISGRTSVTTVTAIGTQTVANYLSDGVPSAGEWVGLSDATPEYLTTSATFNFALLDEYNYDDSATDAATITFSNMGEGHKVRIKYNRASAPAYSGETPTQLPNTFSAGSWPANDDVEAVYYKRFGTVYYFFKEL